MARPGRSRLPRRKRKIPVNVPKKDVPGEGKGQRIQKPEVTGAFPRKTNKKQFPEKSSKKHFQKVLEAAKAELLHAGMILF